MSHGVKVDPVTAGLFFVFQLAVILIYAFLVEYSDDQKVGQAEVEEKHDAELARLYPFFQDVHVMVFIGFGFLMTFMRRYSMSAVAFNFLISAAMMLWTIPVLGLWHRAFGGESFFHKIQLTPADLIKGDFGAAAVMITFGAVLGKAGPAQLLVMGILEIIFYGLNETIGVEEYQAVDMGGSMFVHMFGAFFGIAASRAFMDTATKEKLDREDKNKSSRTTDTFAMIGTLFLFLFWPSFNGALATGSPRVRVVINTVLAIAASCTAAFMSSYVLRGGLFSMVDIQNATLAGGVAVGSSSDLVVEAWPSILIGTLAGILSVVGYVYISPALEKAGLHDTCGVLNLHGLPGLMGAIGGAIAAAAADESVYGADIGAVFPARSDLRRTASYQAGMQICTMFTTLGISLGGGLLTGLVMRFVPNAGDARFEVFEDARWWEELADEAGSDNEPENNQATAPDAVVTIRND